VVMVKRKVDPERLKELYERGLAYREIAKELSVHIGTVFKWVKKLRLPKRKRGYTYSHERHWVDHYEKERKILYDYLKKHGVVPQKIVVKDLGWCQEKLRSLITLFPEDFIRFKFVIGSTGGVKYRTYSLVDGLSLRHSGVLIALKDDERIDEFIMKHINVEDMTHGKHCALYRLLKRSIGEERARKIIQKCKKLFEENVYVPYP